MEVLIYLVPLAVTLGALGLAAFLWSLRNGQYDDLDGAAWRAIADDEPVDSAPAEPSLRPSADKAGSVMRVPARSLSAANTTTSSTRR
jgi:cbb3-type cytochrome oxidase maturation protein